MKETLLYIVKSIVDNEKEVSVEEREEEGVLNLIITVAKDDMGKIIGKSGKVIRGIRNIMKIKAMKHGIRINVSIAETPQE